jgi:flagellar motor switch protein FliN
MDEHTEGQPMNAAPDAGTPEGAPVDRAAAGSAEGMSASDRLQAVLDVDLPLIARFGSTVVSLKTLAALGSGSMVDMNRAPEDLVDLLVGNRVIARGEVVVVGGHYGVRITELTQQARPSAGLMEA